MKRTGKVWGSKFLAKWDLSRIVDWIQTVVEEEGWQLQPGTAIETERLLQETIGLVSGVITSKIKVVCDGRYVHAYPIKE